MDIKCDQIQELLSAYIDGELNADESASVKTHIEACKKCAVELSELKSVVATVGKLPRQAAPSHILNVVQTEIESKGNVVELARHRKVVTYISVVAAVILLSFIITIALMQTADKVAPIPAQNAADHKTSYIQTTKRALADKEKGGAEALLEPSTVTALAKKSGDDFQPLAVIISSDSPHEDYMKVITLISDLHLTTERDVIEAQSGISKVTLTLTGSQLDGLMTKMKSSALNCNIENNQLAMGMAGEVKAEYLHMQAAQSPKAEVDEDKKLDKTEDSLKKQKAKSEEKVYLSPVKYKVDIYFKKAATKQSAPK